MKAKIMKIAMSILGFSGVASCEINNQVEMYGAPYSTFTVKGKVQNIKGEPLRNITLTIHDSEHADMTISAPYTTSADGKYSITAQNTFRAPYKFDIEAYQSEITNGKNYAPKTVQFTVTEDDKLPQKPTNSWDWGSYSKEVNIVMEQTGSEATR